MKSDGTMRPAEIIIPAGLTASQSYSYYSHYYYDEDTPVGSYFLFNTKSAIVNGQVYFFGGGNDNDSYYYKVCLLTLARHGDDFALRAIVHHIWCIL